MHTLTEIHNLFCRKSILLIMKILNLNIIPPKSSAIIYNSKLICCLLDRDFMLLMFWTRDLTLYVYIYIYIIYYKHIFARAVKRVLRDKSQHFCFFAPVICLWLFITKSYLLWIQMELFVIFMILHPKI
jgi:hypothetical protein